MIIYELYTSQRKDYIGFKNITFVLSETLVYQLVFWYHRDR